MESSHYTILNDMAAWDATSRYYVVFKSTAWFVLCALNNRRHSYNCDPLRAFDNRRLHCHGLCSWNKLLILNHLRNSMVVQYS